MSTPRVLDSRRLLYGLISGLITFVLLLLLSISGVLDHWELSTSDMLRKTLIEPLNPDILMVYPDQANPNSSENDSRFFTSRFVSNDVSVLGFLKRAGAKAVVFDMPFTDPNHSQIKYDKAFAKALKQFGNTFGTFQSTKIPLLNQAQILYPSHLYALPLSPDLSLPVAQHLDFPPPPLWGAFTGLGEIPTARDSGNPCRPVTLLVKYQQKVYPQLALSVYWNLQNRPPLVFRENKLQIGNRSFTLDQDGQMDLLIRRIPDEQIFSLSRLMISDQDLAKGKKPLENLSQFKDKIIFIVPQDPHLHDLQPALMGHPTLPDLTSAITLDNLLAGRCLKIIRISGLEWGWILLASLIISVLTTSIPWILVPIFLVFFSFWWIGLSMSIYVGHQILFPLVLPWGTLWLSMTLGSVARFLPKTQYSELKP